MSGGGGGARVQYNGQAGVGGGETEKNGSLSVRARGAFNLIVTSTYG